MGKLTSLLLGAGAGAAWMYFFDRDVGQRRRAMLRDRALSLRNQFDDAIETSVNDLRNRTRGILAEGMAALNTEPVSDSVLAERVRARLGFLTRHPGAIDVTVEDQTVFLSGDVLGSEVDGLVRGLRRLNRVKNVKNRLRVHATAGNIPQLQGEGWMPGDHRTTRQWAPSTRLLVSLAGGYLFLYGMLRGGFIGALSKLGGLGLTIRAIGNMDLRRLAGASDQGDIIRMRKSINIQSPVNEVYELWSNFENFPQFMNHIEQINDLGEGYSHWMVKGPAGTLVEFDAVMTENKPNELIAWETVAESQVKHHGQVRFKQETNKRTQVNIQMTYTPPAGVVGLAVANIFGVDPKSAMNKDLNRMKSLLEDGKTHVSGHKVTREEIPVTGTMSEQDAQSGHEPGPNPPHENQRGGPGFAMD